MEKMLLNTGESNKTNLNLCKIRIKQVIIYILFIFFISLWNYSVALLANSPMQVWTENGIFLPIAQLDGNSFVTYNQFNKIMQNLLSYTIHERYTYNSGDMYLRRHEAFAIVARAIAAPISHGSFSFTDSSDIPTRNLGVLHNLYLRGYISNIVVDSTELRPMDYITKYDLAQFFSNLFGIIITYDGITDLNNRSTSLKTIINIPVEAGYIVVENLNSFGDIIIVSNLNRIILNNIHTMRDIVILRNSYIYSDSSLNLLINESSARNVFVHSPSEIFLTGDSNIYNIGLFASNYIDTSKLSERNFKNFPNVAIYSQDTFLMGSFNIVRNFENNNIVTVFADMISFEARIPTFITGKLDTQDSINESFVNLIDNDILDITEIYNDIFAILLENYAMLSAYILENLGDSNRHLLEWVENLASISFRLANWTPPLPSPPATPTPTAPPSAPMPLPTAPPSPMPDLDDYEIIEHISFDIVPPNHLGYMQGNIESIGFYGDIEWKNALSNLPVSNFEYGGLYTAVLVLIPRQGFAFYPNLSKDNVNVLLEGQITYIMTNFNASPFKIEFELEFGRLGRELAQAFKVAASSSTPSQIRIYTHYLGELLPSHFEVYRGQHGNISNKISIEYVSRYNPINGLREGYYKLEISFGSWLLLGEKVYVFMPRILNLHYPYLGIVYTDVV